MPKPVVIDFETDAIQPRPDYPPRPVGVAIHVPGKKPQYLAWGHPTGNNCTKEKARAILADLWSGSRELLFHNAKFDLDVAEEHLGLKLPSWERVHDTLYLLFLKNPHALSLSLKPAAEEYLGMPPEERDAVRDWLVTNCVIASTQSAGAFISKAPGDVVAAYAIGDVVRTGKLFDLLHPGLDAGMRTAYDRERRLMPLLLENERQGIRFDMDRAEEDLPVYEEALVAAEGWLRKRLKIRDRDYEDGFNFDSDADVADALAKAKVVTEFTLTKTGRRSVAKKNLTLDKFHDQEVFKVLGYRNRLQTVLSLNLRPWFDMAGANDGKIYTEWNQVRQSHGNDGSKGTRTGRLSCSRFQNISKDFGDKGDGYTHPTALKLPELPLVRKYLLPDKGEVFCHRDYSQQEFRIIAHYAEGELLEAYRRDPRTDFHRLMQDRLKDNGVDIQRRLVKITNFSIKYGSGAPALAGLLGVPVTEAAAIIQGVKRATPSVTNLNNELKARGREGKPIRTWGGRLYYCEPGRYVEKYQRHMTFEYKLFSYLIQGSGADCAKEAILRYHEVKRDSRMLVTVHDEINITAPKGAVKREMKVLREAMESIEFDVPMLTDGDVGPSWGELSTYEEG